MSMIRSFIGEDLVLGAVCMSMMLHAFDFMYSLDFLWFVVVNDAWLAKS